MKKGFLIALAAVFLMFSAGCSYDPNATDEDVLSDDYTLSADGYVYTVLSDLRPMKSLCDVSSDSEISDKPRKHYETIEKEHGCTVSLQITTDTIESDVFRTSTGKSGCAGLIETDAAINVGVSGSGVVKAALEKCDGNLAEAAETVKKTAFKITRTGQLVADEVSRRLGVPFGTVDLLLAPPPAVGDSVAYILEEMGLEKC